MFLSDREALCKKVPKRICKTIMSLCAVWLDMFICLLMSLGHTPDVQKAKLRSDSADKNFPYNIQ